MTVKTVEILVFRAENCNSRKRGQAYAVPLTSNLLENHPIMECLRAAKFVIPKEEDLPDHIPVVNLGTFLVHEDPSSRHLGKIPIVNSGFDFRSELVREVFKKCKIEYYTASLDKRSMSISMIDASSIRIIARLRGSRLEPEYKDLRQELLVFAIDREYFELCKIIILQPGVRFKDAGSRCLGFFIPLCHFCRAIRNNSVRMLQFLRDLGAQASKGGVPRSAPRIGNVGFMECLLRHWGPFNIPRWIGPTALHEAKTPEMAKFFIDSGVNVNAVTSDNKTPLHYAVKRKEARVVRVLLESNANIGAVENRQGWNDDLPGWDSSWQIQSNAVVEAAYLDNSTIFDMLIKFGANAKFGDLLYTPICRGAFSGEVDDLEKLEPYFNFIFQDFNKTAMVYERLECILNSFNEIPTHYPRAEIHTIVGIAEKVSSLIIKVEVAYGSRGPRIPEKTWREFKLTEFKERCENEVKIMKQRNVPGTSTSFHDVLTVDPFFASRLFRNVTVALLRETRETRNSALKNDSLFGDIPIYRGVLESRLSRASWRRRIVNEGLKLLAYLLPQFTALPWSVRETIVDLLTNQDILILETCFSRKQLKTIVGVPNCQTLLDEL